MARILGVDESFELLHVGLFVKQAVEERRLDPIWCSTSLYCVTMLRMIRIDAKFATGVNVSSKFTPYFCREPFATRRALYRSMIPSTVS